MKIRICLKDKSSVVAIVDNIKSFRDSAERKNFVSYINNTSKKKEYVNSSEILFIRESSLQEED